MSNIHGTSSQIAKKIKSNCYTYGQKSPASTAGLLLKIERTI